MNADKNLDFNPRLSVFIRGHNSLTRSDGSGSETGSEPLPSGSDCTPCIL